MRRYKPLIMGLLGMFSLIGIYFLVLGFLNSFNYALSQFRTMWYWFVILSGGFGIQVGLYSYIKNYSSINVSKKTMVSSGGMSTGSMIICCLHHVAELLPLVGFSAAAIFLTRYQIPFILVGITFNLIGILTMLSNIKAHGLFDSNRFFRILGVINMKTAYVLVTLSGALVITYSVISIS